MRATVPNQVSAEMNGGDGLAVLMPSFDRPEIFETTLRSWLKADSVRKIFIVAEATSRNILKRYKEIIKKYEDSRIVCKLSLTRLGSVRSRNTLLDMASEYDSKFMLMVDDDYLLPDKDSLTTMVRKLSDEKIGAVGGKVIVKRRREDPDFFLNLPFGLADFLSRAFGYIFLDIKHGPRYSEFLPPFFMVKKDILDRGVRYDEIFDTPTGYREESDFQFQIKYLGYKLLYDPEVRVFHLAAERGGNRPKISMGERMYWKARNHTIFILKWNGSILKRVWYILASVLILSLYRMWHIMRILRGVKDAMSYRYKIRVDLHQQSR